MNLLADLLSFLYPQTCPACGTQLRQGEYVLCGRCMAELPYTGYESRRDNPVARNLCARVPLESAWALFDFHPKGCVQTLLHLLKYNRMPQVGRFLGRCMAQKCLENHQLEGIDYAVPVPLHPKKLKKRGYNQALCLIEGMQDIVPLKSLPDLLQKREMTQSQTKKDRVARWQNVRDGFALNREVAAKIAGEPLHILLVDDVITTGATLESCCRELLKIPGIKVSVASVATPA